MREWSNERRRSYQEVDRGSEVVLNRQRSGQGEMGLRRSGVRKEVKGDKRPFTRTLFIIESKLPLYLVNMTEPSSYPL